MDVRTFRHKPVSDMRAVRWHKDLVLPGLSLISETEGLLEMSNFSSYIHDGQWIILNENNEPSGVCHDAHLFGKTAAYKEIDQC